MSEALSKSLLYILIAVLGTSLLRALYTYGYAVWKNAITNGATYLWHMAHPDEELYRNYFFGPWRHQIKLIYIDCREIITLEPTFAGISWLQEKISEIDITKIPLIVRFFIIIPMFWLWFFIHIYHYFERFFSVIFTALLLFIFTVLHTIVAIPVSGVGKIIMNFNKAKEIASRAQNNRAIRCTHCLEESTDCFFRCPQCQRVHQNLHPSKYGIWNTRCDCGYKLPLTHKGRQRNLSVHEVCPLCMNDLIFAMSKNFGIQLIGGSSAGKTTFLAAFWHEYTKRLEAFSYNSLKFYTVPSEKFDELEFCFKTGTSNATSERTAITYTISHELPDSDTMLNFSIYDIAGEVFSDSTYERTQSQYTYCEGLVVLVDPLTSLEFRQRIGFDEDELQGYSQNSPFIILSSFLETYKNLNRYRKNLVNVPLSIIITKSDISVVNQRIGLENITQKFKEQEYSYNFEFANARDTICKEFLFDIDFSDFLQMVDANFKNVHYFPATAMGHHLNGMEYQPNGVFEGVEWLLSSELKTMLEKGKKNMVTGEQQSKKVEYVKPEYKPAEKPNKPAPKVISQADIEKELAEEEAKFREQYAKMQQTSEQKTSAIEQEKHVKKYVDPDEFFGNKKPVSVAPIVEVPQVQKTKIEDNIIFFDEPLEEFVPETAQPVYEKYIVPATTAPKPVIKDNEIFFDEPLEEFVHEITNSIDEAKPVYEKYIVPATTAPKPVIKDNEIFFDEPLEEFVPTPSEDNSKQLTDDEPIQFYNAEQDGEPQFYTATDEDEMESLAAKYAQIYGDTENILPFEEVVEAVTSFEEVVEVVQPFETKPVEKKKSESVDDFLSMLNND
ncbi:hypothetical protein FACS1894132_08600 [Clostridia bacterium]|nr:hypothetical protein FACS1894132_08600 [Clostridia bacterium]